MKMTTNEFIKRSSQTHHNYYSYHKSEYHNSSTKILITCPKHGDFIQNPSKHMSGSGCPNCGLEKATKFKSSTKEFIEKAKKIHDNKYDYSLVDYKSWNKKVIIICPTHGEFKQTPNSHLNRSGCPDCGLIRMSKNQSSNKNEFIKKSKKIHGNKYDYSNVHYINAKQLVNILCPIHGLFKQSPSNHLNGFGCKKCGYNHISQDEISSFIKSIGYNVKIDDKTIIPPMEIDISIVNTNILIEYNGLYWHSFNKSESSADKNRHKTKVEQCDKLGCQLITIFENEWLEDKELVKSMIKSKLGITSKIHARKCEISTISNHDYKSFIDSNHIQKWVPANIKYGLTYDNKIVSVMSFNRHKKYGWEISRLASLKDYTIVGGASKMLSKFIKDYKPSSIMTYSDRRWSCGNVYKILGFKEIYKTKPNYYYVAGKKLLSRHKFQKHKLNKTLKTYNSNKSESYNMFNNGYRRIWNCGNIKFLLELD